MVLVGESFLKALGAEAKGKTMTTSIDLPPNDGSSFGLVVAHCHKTVFKVKYRVILKDP